MIHILHVKQYVLQQSTTLEKLSVLQKKDVFTYKMLNVSITVTNLHNQIWFESDERSSRHVGATYTGPVTFFSFIFYFLFFNRATANTGEPIFAHNSTKDAF